MLLLVSTGVKRCLVPVLVFVYKIKLSYQVPYLPTYKLTITLIASAGAEAANRNASTASLIS